MGPEQEIAELKGQLVDLQTQLAFQEDTITALDAVVTRQQRQLENLEELWQGHKSQLEQIADELNKGVAEERPPHY